MSSWHPSDILQTSFVFFFIKKALLMLLFFHSDSSTAWMFPVSWYHLSAQQHLRSESLWFLLMLMYPSDILCFCFHQKKPCCCCCFSTVTVPLFKWFLGYHPSTQQCLRSESLWFLLMLMYALLYIPNPSFGDPLDPSGCPLDILWISSGHPLDMLWNPPDTLWTSSECWNLKFYLWNCSTSHVQSHLAICDCLFLLLILSNHNFKFVLSNEFCCNFNYILWESPASYYYFLKITIFTKVHLNYWLPLLYNEFCWVNIPCMKYTWKWPFFED